MDCLPNDRGRIGYPIPLVLARNTGRDSSFTVRSIFGHVLLATDDGKEDEKNSLMEVKVLGQGAGNRATNR
jgi:hypothetical protein